MRWRAGDSAIREAGIQADIASKGGLTAARRPEDTRGTWEKGVYATYTHRLTGVSAHVSVLADRLGRADSPAPLSVMLHDEDNQLTLCRIFRVRDKRLILTAVSTSADLYTSALDPALGNVDAVLSNPERR